ncbi:MAG: hypothetical protein EOO10_13690 [Chitinophagaceae bacterium]|nr:MAG: hypothetical protein EOO10_13690 [Chitinophagaceae bacterium]
MKTKTGPRMENPKVEKTIPLARAKDIMREEGIDYTDEELKEVLQFVAKVVSITTTHYERVKQKEATIININTSTTHETKSLPLHPRQYRRAS